MSKEELLSNKENSQKWQLFKEEENKEDQLRKIDFPLELVARN